MSRINMKIFSLLFVLVTQLYFVNLSFGQNITPFPGTVIAESPTPLSKSYASPSIVVLSNGDYFASHDMSSTITGVYKSTDKGVTWEFLSLVFDSHWSTLFYHDNTLYLLGVVKSFDHISIHKSVDGGNTWTAATDTNNGIILEGSFHTAPTPVIVHNGRIWKAYEESPNPNDERDFYAFMFSAPVGADLLKASSWTKSSTVPLNSSWFNADGPEWLEGNAVVDPNGDVVNVIRMSTPQQTNGSLAMNGYATGIPRYEVGAKLTVSADGLTTSFNPSTGFIHFPGAMTKFTIRYDPVSAKYWTIVNKITTVVSGWDNASTDAPWNQRNVLMLTSSTDLINWQEHYKIVRWNEGDIINRRENFGFQYVDWDFDGDDIVAVSRTSWYGSDWHDANLITFHRLPDFKSLTMTDSPADLSSYTQSDPAVLAWQFGNPSTLGTEATANSNLKHANIKVSTLTRGSGLAPFSFDRSFSSSSNSQHNSKSLAIERDEYLQFEVQPEPGFNVDLTAIDAVFSKNSFGNKSYRWTYSTDGTNFNDIGSGEYYGFVEDISYNVQPTVRLVNYSDLQNASSAKKITFRLYSWGSTTSFGRFSIGRFGTADDSPSLMVRGKVYETPAVEEPLVGWKFDGISGTAADNLDAEVKSTELMPSSLTRGSGFTAAGLNNGYYALTPIHTKSEALAGEDFYEFSVQTNSGKYVSLNKLHFKLRRNSSGPTVYRWSYSLDDVNFTELTNTDMPFIGTDNYGHIQAPIDLSGITALQNIASTQQVKFRLYAWSGLSTSGGIGFARYTDDYCLALYGNTSDQVITAWAFSNPSINGKELTSDATTVNTNIQQSVLTRGNNVVGTSGSTSSFAANFPITAIKQDAINAGHYFQFTMKPNPGFKFSLSSLDARLRVQENAPHHYAWQYSTDGVNFFDLGLADNTINTTINNGQAVPQIDLSAYADLQNVMANITVTFRLYAWGGTGTSDNSFGIGKSLSGANALIVGGLVEEDNTLPVELTYFNGEQHNNRINLKWNTASERNNSHFNILKSTDGNNFSVLSVKQASSPSGSTYSYIDVNPHIGFNYYQLQQVDIDGAIELSKIIAIPFNFSKDKFWVYARHDDQVIKLFINSSDSGIKQVKIIDLLGKVLANVPINLNEGLNTIDLPLNLSTGVYVAMLIDRDGAMKIKFICE